MKIRVEKGSLGGVIPAIPAKAYAHRILICAALSDAPTLVRGLYPSEDILTTKSCLQNLGARFEERPDGCLVVPPQKFAERAVLDCAESGSTLRFLLPLAATLGVNATFVGRGKLPERPLDELIGTLLKYGVKIDGDRLPLTTQGTMAGERFAIDGSISSQYVTGMLLSLAAMGGKRLLEVKGKRVSGSYIDITVEILRAFGAEVEQNDVGFSVCAPNRLRSPREITVEGDWSNAAFFLVAGAIGDKGVTVTGLNANSCQGDSAIVDVLTRMNADVTTDTDKITVKPSRLKGAKIDCSDCPDLAPILSVAAAHAEGETVISGAERLKLKECDRLSAIIDLMNACDVSTSAENDKLYILGGQPSFCEAACRADHRMIMSAAIMGSSCGATIDNADGVKKSYPDFFEDFSKLGGSYAVTL